MRLGGEIADGVILNWCPPERVSFARACIAEGAERWSETPRPLRSRSTCGRGWAATRPRRCPRCARWRVGTRPTGRTGVSSSRWVSGLGRRSPGRRTGPEDPRTCPRLLVRSVCALGDGARDRLDAFRDAGADLPIVYPVATADPSASIEATSAPSLRPEIPRRLAHGPVSRRLGLQGRHRGKRKTRGRLREGTGHDRTICESCIDIKDKACVDECPVDCIYEGPRMLYIHPDECVDCARASRCVR